MKSSLSVAVATVFFSALLIAPVLASSLKVTGTDGTPLAVFDREKIEAIGMRSIMTQTPWTDGVAHFQGSPMSDVLAQSGAAGRDVTALAFDDYAMTITAETISKYSPIIATRLNGQLLSLDNKGPFWIMFDFDDIPEEKSAELRSHAVWHLIEFEVE